MIELKDSIDFAMEAYWNAIPCHVPYTKYLNEHPDGEKIRLKLHQIMEEAIKAYIKSEHLLLIK